MCPASSFPALFWCGCGCAFGALEELERGPPASKWEGVGKDGSLLRCLKCSVAAGGERKGALMALLLGARLGVSTNRHWGLCFGALC